MGNPILPPVVPPWGVYTPGVPNNLLTVTALLGDAGDSSDGFDDAYAAVSAIFAITDPIEQAWLAEEPVFEAAADVYMAITDEISGILAVATALYDVTESGLGAAIISLTGLGNAPQPASLPPIPGLPNVVVPQPVDITALIATVTGGEIESAVDEIEAYLDSYLGSILSAPASTYNGPGEGSSFYY
jgi:hypothetical protein